MCSLCVNGTGEFASTSSPHVARSEKRKKTSPRWCGKSIRQVFELPRLSEIPNKLICVIADVFVLGHSISYFDIFFNDCLIHAFLHFSLLNFLWHKGSSNVLVNKTLKANFNFEVTLLNICMIHKEQAAAKAGGECAFSNAGLGGLIIGCAQMKPKGPRSDCLQKHFALVPAFPTALKDQTTVYVRYSEPLHFSGEYRSHNNGRCLATHCYLPSFKQAQASTFANYIPSVLTEKEKGITWEQVISFPAEDTKLSLPAKGSRMTVLAWMSQDIHPSSLHCNAGQRVFHTLLS